jgi:hypothetical protein
MDSMTNTRMRALARTIGFSERPDPDDRSQVICYLDLQPAAEKNAAKSRTSPEQRGPNASERRK